MVKEFEKDGLVSYEEHVKNLIITILKNQAEIQAKLDPLSTGGGGKNVLSKAE